MKLGISSYTYTWAIGVPGQEPVRPMSATELLDKTAGYGLSVLQIADNMPLHALSEADLDALVAQADALNIQIEVGTRGIAPEHLQTYLDLAVRFGSPFVRVVIDTADHHPSVPETVTLIRKSLPAFVEAGVTLVLENHDRFSTSDFLHVMQTFDSPFVGICLDTVNSFGALEGPEVVVQALAPWTVNLHIKDFLIRRADHMMGFIIEGTPAGQGRLDVAWLLDTMKAYGRTPNAILELWTPPEASIEASVEKEQRWAEESVTFLKNALREYGG